jgi:hypothetical protein
MTSRPIFSAAGALCAAGWFAAVPAAPAIAQPIANQVAIFAGLDKITARIYKIEIPIDRTAVFGALEVTPRACFTRPPTEPPKTTAFVEVKELRHNASPKRIFNGWMFAANPGLHGVEHPVYDVWLTDCKTAAPSPSKPKP